MVVFGRRVRTVLFIRKSARELARLGAIWRVWLSWAPLFAKSGKSPQIRPQLFAQVRGKSNANSTKVYR